MTALTDDTLPITPRAMRDEMIVFVLMALLLAIVRLLFNGRKVSKLGLAGLVWAYTPRTLKIVAAGLALAATIVLVGALAAITLLALQLI